MSNNPKLILFKAIMQVMMTLLLFIYIFPFFISILTAFKDKTDMFNLSLLQFPTKLYWGNFMDAIKTLKYLPTMGISVFVTLASVACIIIICSMAAYTFARRKSKWYKLLFGIIITGILIPYQAIFVPIYLVGNKLGFVNTLYGLIFFYTATSLPFGVFLTTGFLKTIPLEIEDAAKIDGCNVFQTFWIIIFPLLKPAVSTLAILQSFLIWNDFLLARLFLQKIDLYTINLRLYSLFGMYQFNYEVAFACVIITCIPVIALFLYLQKYLIKGITFGAVKG